MKKIVFVVVALLAMSAVTGVAVAKTKKFESDITVKYVGGGDGDPYYEAAAFKGHVKSDKAACEQNRKVTIKAVGAGKVGSDFTNDDGKYRIDASGFGPGKYKAKAVKKVIKQGNDKIVCKSAKANITVT